MEDERRQLVEKAKLAEEAGRWNEMANFTIELLKKDQELSAEERSLLANAYKNYVGSKRAAWRVISDIEKKIEVTSRKRELCKEFRVKIEDELKSCCNILLQLLEKHLNSTADIENHIFFFKLQGDYFRYLAEFSRKSNEVIKANLAYSQGYEMARENLNPAHPLLLGLVLNFSVFFYEVMDLYDKANEIASTSLDVAKLEFQHLPESYRSDSLLIIQLIKENLKVWAVEMDRATVRSHTSVSRFQ